MRLSESSLRDIVRKGILEEALGGGGKRKARRALKKAEVKKAAEDSKKMKARAIKAVEDLIKSGEVEADEAKRYRKAAKKYGKAYEKLIKSSLKANLSHKPGSKKYTPKQRSAAAKAKIVGKLRNEFPEMDEKIVDLIAVEAADEATATMMADFSANIDKEMEDIDISLSPVSGQEKDEEGEELYSKDELEKMVAGGGEKAIYAKDELEKMIKGGTKSEPKEKKVKILIRDKPDNYEYSIQQHKWHARKKGSNDRWSDITKYGESIAMLRNEFPDDVTPYTARGVRGSGREAKVTESIISRGDLRNIIYEVISADQPEGDPSTNKELKKSYKKEFKSKHEKMVANDKRDAKRLKSAAEITLNKMLASGQISRKEWRKYKKAARKFLRADKKFQDSWHKLMRKSLKRVMNPSEKRKLKEQIAHIKMKSKISLRNHLLDAIPEEISKEVYDLIWEWADADRDEENIDSIEVEVTSGTDSAPSEEEGVEEEESSEETTDDDSQKRYDIKKALLALGDGFFDRGKGWEYFPIDDVWHTRKSGTDGRWISLAGSKWDEVRKNLDGYFPEALNESVDISVSDIRKIIRKKIRRS